MNDNQIADMRLSIRKKLSETAFVLTETESQTIEIADFGLNDFEQSGLGIITYVNTDKVCAKELIMLPHQTCPEHRHPPVGEHDGKEETFRCRSGMVYLYVEGQPTSNPVCRPPIGRESTYTCFHEVALGPGEQFTIMPNTKHWFQAGSEGAVISEFSTTSRDECDVFTDPEIKRVEEG